MADNETELPLLPSLPSDHFQQQQQHVEDDEVTIDMEKMIQDCRDGALSSECCCICRVPLVLRQLNKEAYTPKVVSIGPFHYGTKRLQDMERYKQVMFKRFIGWARSSLNDLVRLVKNLEPKIRASYSETIKLTEHQLVKLALTDAGFIIDLFIMGGYDAKLSLPSFQSYIVKDLLLLENQLPFFVIEEVFNKAFLHDSSRSSLSFLELSYEYFGGYNKQKLEPNPDDKIKHFTDLLRLFYLQRNSPKRNPCDTHEGSQFLLYNANALHEAGITLKPTMGKCLLDLKLSGHTLEISQIFVEDRTEVLFRNMIALEQCYYPYDAYITDYVIMSDCLVDTHKDVDLLVDKKILSHYLSDSHPVASLFNGLLKNVVQSRFNSEYLDICQRLNGYCQDPKHKLKTTLKRDYCNTPWHTVASIAGIILLVLTILQTIFSVLQVVLK